MVLVTEGMLALLQKTVVSVLAKFVLCKGGRFVCHNVLPRMPQILYCMNVKSLYTRNLVGS